MTFAEDLKELPKNDQIEFCDPRATLTLFVKSLPWLHTGSILIGYRTVGSRPERGKETLILWIDLAAPFSTTDLSVLNTLPRAHTGDPISTTQNGIAGTVAPPACTWCRPRRISQQASATWSRHSSISKSETREQCSSTAYVGQPRSPTSINPEGATAKTEPCYADGDITNSPRKHAEPATRSYTNSQSRTISEQWRRFGTQPYQQLRQ
jgi:hypothetical protein